MALRGNLNDFSLPDVFQLVTFSRKTGVLRIKRADGAEGSVWFREGDVFFAQSNWHAEMLGERLVRAQRVTPQALKKALEIRAGEGPEGRRLGAILVDEGYIGEPVLESFVQEQIQETIFDLMRWDEGDFDFEELPDIDQEDIGLSISIENVVMEGSRRLDEWGRIKKKIPSMDVVFKMSTAPGEGTFEISLKPIEWNLLLLVDGTRSVAELALETRRTDFDVARIIYGLFSAGLLEFTADDEVERLRSEKRERDAARAEVRAARRAAEEASRAAVETRPAAEKPEPSAQAAAAPQAAAAEAEAEAEPLFFSAQLPGPTAEDAAVLEEMMGAVLQRPAPLGEMPAPVAPVPGMSEIPAPELLEVPEIFEAAETAEAVTPAIPQEPPIAPTVPGLDLPLIPVLSAEDLISDLSPLEAPEQTLEQALSAVAEAASVGLGVDLETPAPEVASGEPIAPLEATAGPAAMPVAQPASIAPPGSLAEPGIAEMPEVTPEPFSVPEISVPEVEPFVPEFESSIPELEPAAAAPPQDVSTYELELMSLGLGELPSDLLGESPIETASTSSAVEYAVGSGEDSMDLGALLESLEGEVEPAEEVAGGMRAGFDADILAEVAPSTPSSGVISTDAFMEEMSLEPIGLAGGMTDELSALTGAQRPSRPMATVTGIPERSGGMLTRDQSVDRDTLLRIIDGIKGL